MPKQFYLVVNIGGRTKYVKEARKRMNNRAGNIYGLTEYIGPKKGVADGCKVWIYSRQTKREIADTFFHEMTHVFLHMFGGVHKQGVSEELLCNWIGWLAKAQLSEYSKDYARDYRKKRAAS